LLRHSVTFTATVPASATGIAMEVLGLRWQRHKACIGVIGRGTQWFFKRPYFVRPPIQHL
jgi:hypothetical protein